MTGCCVNFPTNGSDLTSLKGFVWCDKDVEPGGFTSFSQPLHLCTLFDATVPMKPDDVFLDGTGFISFFRSVYTAALCSPGQ